jgi:hypothetical protein
MMAKGTPHYAAARQLSLVGWRLCAAVAWLSLAALGTSPAAAEGIYRWVDEHGRVHFGSHPGAANARRLDIETTPPTAPADDAALSRRQAGQRRLLDDFTRERELRRAEEAEREARRRERAAACTELERYRNLLTRQGPVYILAPDGSRDYLDDRRRAAELQRITPEIRAACGAPP